MHAVSRKMDTPPFDNSRDPDPMESASSSAPTTSFVSRTKTALHSAAAMAEKVLTGIKADLRNDRDGDWQVTKKDSFGDDVSDKAREEVLNPTLVRRGSIQLRRKLMQAEPEVKEEKLTAPTIGSFPERRGSEKSWFAF